MLPAVLVLVGVLPFWESLRHRRDLQASIAGVNAGVVGILLAALYDPVWTSAIHDRWMSRWHWLRSGYWSSRVLRRS